jgi:hypothetical protein
VTPDRTANAWPLQFKSSEKMIQQVFSIACGAQASAATESIPKELARQRATITTRHDACAQTD